MNKPAKLVPCPTCGNLSEFSPKNQFRPFCCERCKMIDLGAWASETYAIADNSEPTLDQEFE